MIAITAHPEGSVLALRVQPGARKALVKGEQAGALKVAVTAPPEDGRANAAVIELLVEVLDIKRKQLELIAGHTSRDKKVLVRGVTLDALRKLVDAIVSRA